MQDYPLLETLNEQQREAVLHTGTPLLILAGAGSGKTRVITTKIAYAVDCLNVLPKNIAAVTFTNKAAREMEERLHRMTHNAHGVTIKTFHSFGALLLRQYGHAIGISPSFLIYDESDSLALIKTGYKKKFPNNKIKMFYNDIMRCKDLCISADGDLEQVNKSSHFHEIYSYYETRLRNTGNLDFGDLIMKTVELLQSSPQIREAIQSRYTMILVDEYQDSNVAQYLLLQELFTQQTELCVVGDDDQSIYSFRGAEIANILSFQDHFPGTCIIRLEKNYRSTRHILEAAGAVVSCNNSRLGKTLISVKGEGEKLQCVILDNHEAEAMYCAKLYDKHPNMETAVIYRMNSQSRAFEEVFTRYGIPFVLVGSLRFYEREEIKDAIAYLNLFVNPLDEIAFRRIVNKPSRGIGAKTIETILSFPGDTGGNVLECLAESLSALSKRARAGATGFLEQFSILADSLGSLSTAEFIRNVIFRTGLFDYYREKDVREGTAKCKNLDELVNAGIAFASGSESLAAFLEGTMLAAPEYETPPGNRIMLITAHNTKGLEFDRVIITGCDDGVFPVIRDFEWGGIDPGAVEEERRLFYVAMTRAREKLILTTAVRRLLFGRWSNSTPSRFLQEIPSQHIETVNLSIQKNMGDTLYKKGERIFHDDYGYGFVLGSAIQEHREIVTVRFDTGKTMKLYPQYTSIVKINDEY
ncbi:MAG: UvrD-helicase domain-containing protein [Spirochaetales bacterium]|nr:UvrD-helicase domain-containing protein [Spirochaetales bacterium]